MAQIVSVKSAASSPRFAWIDNLRTLLIAFVVSVHACVTYSHVGGWYFKEGVEPPLSVKLPFLLWEAHLQSFFMGLLFLIAGYFSELSLQRKTTAKFLKERLLRLGVPLLLYVFVIHPVMVWGINPWSAEFPPLGEWYARYLRSGDFAGSTGPLWFAEALLIFCFVFALRRGPRSTNALDADKKVHGVTVRGLPVLALMLGLGLVSFLVRLVQPIGTSVLNLQLCFFPQYMVAFPLGVWLARRRGLADVAQAPLARRIGWCTLIVSPIVLFGLIVSMSSYSGHGEPPLFGGMNIFAVGYAFWEQCAGVGLSLGILAFAFAKMNQDTALTRWAADRSFAVYVLHSPILLALTTYSRGLSANPFLMAAYATLATLGLSFAAAEVVRRIPGLNRAL